MKIKDMASVGSVVLLLDAFGSLAIFNLNTIRTSVKVMFKRNRSG